MLFKFCKQSEELCHFSYHFGNTVILVTLTLPEITIKKIEIPEGSQQTIYIASVAIQRGS